MLSSILGAVPQGTLGVPRPTLDYRALYRMHRNLEMRRKAMRFEKAREG